MTILHLTIFNHFHPRFYSGNGKWWGEITFRRHFGNLTLQLGDDLALLLRFWAIFRYFDIKFG